VVGGGGGVSVRILVAPNNVPYTVIV